MRLNSFLHGCLSLAGLAAAGWLFPAHAARANDDGFIRYTTDTASISLPFWYAEENGLFAKYGLKYNDTLVNAAFLGLQSIGGGQNDASVQSDPPTITNIAAGIDAIIVAVIAKGSNSMALVATKPAASVTDLKGKKVAWLAGSGGELGFIKYLEANKLSLNDFEHVNLAPAEAIPALVGGKVDAIWYWQPWPRKAMELKGDGLSVIWKSISDQYEPNMILTVRRAFAKDKPETLKNFLRVLLESVESLKMHPKKAIDVLMRRLRMSREDATVTLGDYPPEISLSGTFVKEITAIADLKVKQGGMKSSPDWNKVVDPSFLRAVAPDKVKSLP